uniref:Auxin-repressed protein n=1 Tax=Rhizophora mucronata TaxID=61149 RepID=A0A2P2LF85_RHIMU
MTVWLASTVWSVSLESPASTVSSGACYSLLLQNL